MLNKQSKIILFACMALLMALTACKHAVPPPPDNGGGGGGGGGGNPTNPCDPNTVYFQQQVLPILVSNCAMSGCHDPASAQDGVVLTSYNSVMNTGDIRPGRPNDSELYEVIMETDPDDRMPRPPQNPLTQQQKDIIYKWIQQGAQNLSCASSACDTASVTYSVSVRNIISNKCQGCHSGGAPQGGIDLTNYTNVNARITDGSLWAAINHQPGYTAMPLNGSKLSGCEIATIRIWITAGSPNN